MSRKQLIDDLAKAMYLGDYNVATGGPQWEKFSKKDKSSGNFPYTKASQYMHRAECAIKFLEERGALK